MAEQQFKEITFTKTDERGDHELTATTPAEAVRLRFDGWREKGKAKPANAAKATPAKAQPSAAG